MTEKAGVYFLKCFLRENGMSVNSNEFGPEPSREEIDHYQGPLLLQFGANWCHHCQGAQPLVRAALEQYPQVHHIMAEDGKGHPLGRSFAVKLWPTLVLIKDGKEVSRLVRPESTEAIVTAINEMCS